MQNAEQISNEVEELRRGGLQAATQMFDQNRERLRLFMVHRTNQRLLRRVDWDDILQETFIVIQTRLDEFINAPRVPFYVWMRALAGQVLIDLHRQHLGAQMRSLKKEISLHERLPFQSTATSVASLLAASGTSPSRALIRSEQVETLRETLDEMNATDREVLVMRHMEQMTNGEVADALNLNESAATKRYIRALKRVRDRIKKAKSR
jgi:RNA polymerase sigma-70 factor (ECF subfamily)